MRQIGQGFPELGSDIQTNRETNKDYYFINQGMVGYPAEHEHTSDLVSSVWGSYFYYPEKKKVSVLPTEVSSFVGNHISNI